MKKIIIAVLAAGVLFAGVLTFRALTLFQKRQVEPANGIMEIRVDGESALNRFSEALRIPTISHDGRSHFDVAAFTGFHDFLQRSYPLVHQYSSRTVINDYSLVYHLPGTEPSLEPVLFMSHMDVVPVEEATLGEWTYPAFDGRVENGTIWGRGAVDNKLGVVSLMEAMEQLLEDIFHPQRDIYFAFGHDEEVGGADGAAKIARYFYSLSSNVYRFLMFRATPETLKYVHGIDEQVTVEDYLQAIRFYYHLIARSMAGQE